MDISKSLADDYLPDARLGAACKVPASMLVVGLFVLSVLSGMLGLGVAFAAVPFLGIFLPYPSRS